MATKEERIQSLLSVLDMSEEKQYKWVEKKGLFHFRKLPNEVECSCKAFISIEESLADLAFRMRDEAVEKYAHL